MKYTTKLTIFTVFVGFLFGSPCHAKPPLPHKTALKQFSQTRSEIETQRKVLLKRYQKTSSRTERNQITKEAKKFVVEKIYRQIVPAWLGMPWTMAVIDDGLKPNAKIPYEKGKGISCSWFVVSVLENAGLRFGNPQGFAGTIAVHLQRSLSPQKKDFKRFFHITPAQLHKRFVKWGDGLYIIGLNCHVGFVHVEGERVTFLHSNYTSPMEVTAEPLIDSTAIELSQSAGYVVSALFKDNRLIHHWLTGNKLYFKGPRK